jgi:hypothetical protein
MIPQGSNVKTFCCTKFIFSPLIWPWLTNIFAKIVHVSQFVFVTALEVFIWSVRDNSRCV